MKSKLFHISLTTLFFALAWAYFSIGLSNGSIDKIFLTLSTFLFALLSGFFIARQSARYNELRKLSADFDGDMSSMYRVFGHFGEDAQREGGEIIKKHYEKVLQHGWDYPLNNKTTTITDLNKLTHKASEQYGTDGIKGAAVSRILFVLSGTQRVRKGMAALYKERIPRFQWTLVYLLAAILILVVSTIDSAGLLLGSAVKAAFVVAVFSIVILLKRLDALMLFSGTVGEHSARDVIEIIEGNK